MVQWIVDGDMIQSYWVGRGFFVSVFGQIFHISWVKVKE